MEVERGRHREAAVEIRGKSPLHLASLGVQKVAGIENASIVDQERYVGRLGGGLPHLLILGDVKNKTRDAGIEQVEAVGTGACARTGIDTRHTAGEQPVDKAATNSPVGAGDEGHGGRNLHSDPLNYLSIDQ